MNGDRFFLEEVGTITKAEVLRKKEVQINTRIHYAQKRCAEHDFPACPHACSPWHCMIDLSKALQWENAAGLQSDCLNVLSHERQVLTHACWQQAFLMMHSMRRFNLLREESEGFAKLLEALLRFEKAAMEPARVKALVSVTPPVESTSSSMLGGVWMYSGYAMLELLLAF